jgi:molybdopterin converting factor small subunit
VIGAGLLLVANPYRKTAFDLFDTLSVTHRDEESPGKPSPPTVLTGQVMGKSDTSVLAIKVVYFQMAQYVSAGDEYFVPPNPAYLRDLLDAVLLRHPSISPQMIASVLVLIDGAPARSGAALEDGNEVDFIPLVAGG